MFGEVIILEESWLQGLKWGVIKGKLKSGKSPSKYDVTREMINSSVEMNLKAV